METEEILAQAKMYGDELPQGWTVFPLLRQKLMIGLLGWSIGIIIGLGLFALIASVVIPMNYQRGPMAAIFTTILLGVLLFVGLGSAWTLVGDIRRIRDAQNHMIVITEQDFVKQEGKKILRVPLSHVRYVTARGLPPPEQVAAQEVEDVKRLSVSENTMGFLLGRGIIPSVSRLRQKRMRAPTSLAFVDARKDVEVIVVEDGAYGDPHTIGATLKERAARAQDLVR